MFTSKLFDIPGTGTDIPVTSSDDCSLGGAAKGCDVSGDPETAATPAGAEADVKCCSLGDGCSSLCC